MPEPPRFTGDLARLEAELVLQPSVVTYARLEPLALTTGDVLPGLQALLGDPLWLLARQWQFEELRGEDGGSPVRVTVEGEHAPLGRFHPGRPGASAEADAVDVADLGLPLEVVVEAEAPARLPERLRAEGGLHLLRLLRAAGLATLRGAVVERWAFPPAPHDPGDPEGSDRHQVLAGRVPDAELVAAALAPLVGGDGTVAALPAGLDAGGADPGAVAAVLTTWWRWYDGYLARPARRPSWDPHHLEYAFAAQADLAAGPVVLHADEYATGTVDWFTFDAASSPSLGAPAAPVAPAPVHEVVLPTPVRYPGMPSDRLWAFEDGRVYLGDLDAGPTDLARLALVEFSLVYGNDWFVVPVDLPAGSVARLDAVVVRDSFGVDIPVGPARQASRPGWTMFHLPSVDDRGYLADVFVLPPTVRNPSESPPLEEVALFRDEMANLVWAVERVVQGPTGERVPRGRLASRPSLRQQVPGDLDDARIVYRLMTPVPEHWIPFVAVPVPGVPVGAFAVELERRPLVRFLEDGTAELVHPHGLLLRADPGGDVATDRLRIAEEEVPRDGVVVTRSFQLARTEGGGTVLWVGRRKRPSQGEGASGLRFDTALPPA